MFLINFSLIHFGSTSKSQFCILFCIWDLVTCKKRTVVNCLCTLRFVLSLCVLPYHTTSQSETTDSSCHIWYCHKLVISQKKFRIYSLHCQAIAIISKPSHNHLRPRQDQTSPNAFFSKLMKNVWPFISNGKIQIYLPKSYCSVSPTVPTLHLTKQFQI